MKPQPIFDIRADHGEGPVWDPAGQKLYWVDIMVGKFYIGDPSIGFCEEHEIGQALGVLALREQGGLVMGVRDGFGFYDLDKKEFSLLEGGPEQHNPDVRFNDGAVDPAGRFFAGTMEWEGRTPTGALYRLDPDHNHQKLEEDIYITNGMDWSPDRKTYYMTDTLRNVIYAYDYEMETGSISNRRDHIVFAKDELPDGMTVDSEGGFWVALWGGSRLVRYDPSGVKMSEIGLPVLHPTSCCFGGPDLRTLYITTSQHPLTEQEKRDYPLAGRTLVLETDVVGQNGPKFKG